MGFFNKFFNKNSTTNDTQGQIIQNQNDINSYVKQATSAVETVPVELTKKISLAKEEVHKVCLMKPVLNGLKAQVGLVLDFSGSMSNLYHNGTIQNVLEKMLPMAMEFDDNGEMEVWIFENGYHRLPNVKLDNIHNYIERETKIYSMGGTEYSPVMKNVVETYSNSQLPSYVLFLTDGDCFDPSESTHIIKEASKEPIFWQFVGLGTSTDFDFLQRLDDMSGRYVDNADFFVVDGIDRITYFNLLNEFPSWITNEKVKAML
jgi:hypothetical protein